MLNGLQDIPSLPQVTVELIRFAYQDEPDIQQIASIIERDATLTAKLFKSVNSAAFGMKNEITSIPQAISILGLETLKATIVSIAVGEYFITNSLGKTIDAKEFCVHSLATAVIMMETAKLLNIKEAEQLFLVGLLHDLGMMVLDTLDSDRFQNALEAQQKGKTLDQAERHYFGCDHNQVWDYLAKEWKFPPAIIKLKNGYVKGDEVGIATRRLIKFSSVLAEALGYYFTSPTSQGLSSPVETFLIPDAQAVSAIGRAVKKQVSAVSELLDLPPPDHAQLLELLWRMNLQLQTTNRKYIKAHRDLKNRVETLEELTEVFKGIVRNLNSESLAFSVVENLIEGFHIDSAFLLLTLARGGLQGYAAISTGDNDASVEQIHLDKKEIPSTIVRCIEHQLPVKLVHPIEDEILKRCLGPSRLVWLAPVIVRDRFIALMGVGVVNEKSDKVNSEAFGKIIQIVASEVGLSVENSRLYDRMRLEARTDPLTSISNRRTVMKILTSEFARFPNSQERNARIRLYRPFRWRRICCGFSRYPPSGGTHHCGTYPGKPDRLLHRVRREGLGEKAVCKCRYCRRR